MKRHKLYFATLWCYHYRQVMGFGPSMIEMVQWFCQYHRHIGLPRQAMVRLAQRADIKQRVQQRYNIHKWLYVATQRQYRPAVQPLPLP